MTCLLRDGSDLLPAWHRLKTDNATAAGRLRGSGTWGRLHVPPLPPQEGLGHKLCVDTNGWMGLAVPGKLDWEGTDFLIPFHRCGPAGWCLYILTLEGDPQTI